MFVNNADCHWIQRNRLPVSSYT